METYLLRGTRGTAFVTIVHKRTGWHAEVTLVRGARRARTIKSYKRATRARLFKPVIGAVYRAIGRKIEPGGNGARPCLRNAGRMGPLASPSIAELQRREARVRSLLARQAVKARRVAAAAARKIAEVRRLKARLAAVEGKALPSAIPSKKGARGPRNWRGGQRLLA